MIRNTLRWTLLGVAMFVLGPLAASLTQGVRAPDGSTESTLLTAEHVGVAAVRLGACFGLAALAGAVAGRAFGVRTGLFGAGLVLAWSAGTAGTIDDIIRRTQSASTFRTLASEGVIIGLLTAGVGVVCVLASRKHEPAIAPAPVTKGARHAGDGRSAARAAGALAACLAAGGLAAAIVARTMLPGQVIAAAACAGIAGAMAGLMVHHHARPHWLLASLCVLGVVGPASAGLAHGEVAHAVYTNHLTPLARLTPLHWAAGLLIGVPIGLSWGSSMIKKSP